MKDLELETFKVSNMFSACELLGDNEMLSAPVVQNVSLIREYCLPIVRAHEKGRNALLKQCKMFIAQDGRTLPTAEFHKLSPEDQTQMRDKFEGGMDELNEKNARIAVPELKKEDFYLLEDRDFDVLIDGKIVKRSMRKGDALVPAKFFMLMSPILNFREPEKKKK